MGNGQRTLWRILAGVLGVLVVGAGATLAIKNFEHHTVSVKANLHQRKGQSRRSGRRQKRTAPVKKAVPPPTATPLMLPVNGSIQANFGWQYSGALNEWYYNPGVTISAKAGRPVKAAWGGTVEKIASQPLTGVEVMIDDGDHFETAYVHLGKAEVKVGQTVSQGHVIGTVGGPDLYSHQAGAHIDFQIYHGGLASNPMGYLHVSS